MTVRVEFHHRDDNNKDTVLWLTQVPGVGDHVILVKGEPAQTVSRVDWDYTEVDSPSAHLKAIRADVYLRPY